MHSVTHTCYACSYTGIKYTETHFNMVFHLDIFTGWIMPLAHIQIFIHKLAHKQHTHLQTLARIRIYIHA